MKFVLACDNNYFSYVYVAIKTLLENNKNYEDLEVVFIEQNVTQENKDILVKLGERYNRDIKIIEFIMPTIYSKLPPFGSSKTTFAKFTFSSLFEDDIVVFLDPDTLILDDISKMKDIDMTGYLFAGVVENLPRYHSDLAGLEKEDSYVNGGVLICNLKLWRETNFEQKVFDYIRKNTKNFNFDQGILNELGKGRIKVIPPKYNVLAEIFEINDVDKLKRRYKYNNFYTQSEINEAINKPTIVHFTHFLYGKPLMKGCRHPFTNLFLKHLDEDSIKYNLSKNNLGYKIKVRRFILHYFPYSAYLFFERILDIRRLHLMKKQLETK